jgi:hypothetical protein
MQCVLHAGRSGTAPTWLVDVKAPLHFKGTLPRSTLEFARPLAGRLGAMCTRNLLLGKLCHLTDAAIGGLGVQNGRRPVSLISLRALFEGGGGPLDWLESRSGISRRISADLNRDRERWRGGDRRTGHQRDGERRRSVVDG